MLSCSGSSTIGSIDARFDLDGQNEFAIVCVDGIATIETVSVGTHSVTLRVRGRSEPRGILNLFCDGASTVGVE